MTEYVIAIPSYRRCDLLINKTLNYLNKHNIPKNKIYIFVANKEEYNIYKKQLPQYNIVIGHLGIFNQRNFISNYFSEGQYIVEMDDDIDEIELKVKDNIYDKELAPLDFKKFVQMAYYKLKYYNLYLWGVNMISNYFHAYKKESTDLRFTVSTLFGFINRKKMIQNKYTQDVGEDIVRTIQYYIHDGGVLRFNDILIKTKFYEKGGIQATMTEEKRRNELKKLVKILVKDIPEFIREKPIKNSNDIGFQLIRKPKVDL